MNFFDFWGKKQIIRNNITNIETIYGGNENIGNALIMLNNLIKKIIKKPITTKDFSITIFLNFYKDKIKIDIKLSISKIKYHIKHHEMRLSILKEEIMNNIPKYKSDSNYLYIHIRSCDIFIKSINPNYSQPPLCFYQK